MYSRTNQGFPCSRRGAADVELAIVLPVFVLLVIGAIDVGRATMVRHKLVEAARAACRLYAVEDQVSSQQIANVVDKIRLLTTTSRGSDV